MKSAAGNRNLHAARAAKNDEFYTQRADIEAELFFYRKYFAGKTVYCNLVKGHDNLRGVFRLESSRISCTSSCR